jgi:hypothetical protein
LVLSERKAQAKWFAEQRYREQHPVRAFFRDLFGGTVLNDKNITLNPEDAEFLKSAIDREIG